MTKRDYFAEYKGYRGNADSAAAVEAFYQMADKYALTYKELTAEWPNEKVKESFGAAVEAAWPNRVTSDPSHEGFIEVYPN